MRNPSSRPATYAKNLLRFLALLVGLSLLAGLTSLAVQSYQAALRSLHPARQAVGQPPDNPPDGRIYRPVEFLTADGVQISAWYLQPAAENPWSIILAHGYAANRRLMLPEATLLAARGYGLLLFDFRGHGESGEADVTIGDHERLDVAAAVEFLAAQAETRRIGGIGFSMGGAALAMTAADDPRLEAVVIEASYPTYRVEILYRARVFGPLSQLPALLALLRKGVAVDSMRPVDALCRISPRPVLLIYGEYDQDVPPGTAEKMGAAACSPAEMWIVPGIGHQNPAQGDAPGYETRLLNLFSPTPSP